MRWLVLSLLALAGCAFFDTDDHSGHLAIPDGPLQSCSGMIFTGDTCHGDAPCEWGEGVDGGVGSGGGNNGHTCTCGSNQKWTCVQTQTVCPSAPPSGTCSDTQGTCYYDHQTSCSCMFGQWRCNSCPADFMSPTATCTPGLSCDYEDWEHGCSCICDGGGSWNCTPQTIGSQCPSHTYDAGV